MQLHADTAMFLLTFLLLSFDMSKATSMSHQYKDQNTTFSNWTTCDEFIEGTTFDINSIIDKDWRVFYMWNLRYEEPYQVRFREATKTLIDQFKIEVDRKANSNVNWNETAFFMESTIDLSALFIRTKTPGKFQVITTLIFQYDNVDPEVIFAIKLVEPGYLGFMNCKIRDCIAFAPIHKMPKDDQLEAAAKLLKVRHPFGFPHNVQDAMLNVPNNLEGGNDDAEDEEEAEVEMFNASML